MDNGYDLFNAPVDEQLDILIVGLENFARNHKNDCATKRHLNNLINLMANIHDKWDGDEETN